MGATHPFLWGVWRHPTDKTTRRLMLLPAIVVNGLSIFYLVTVATAMAVNNKGGYFNFALAAGFVIVYLVCYQVATGLTLVKAKTED